MLPSAPQFGRSDALHAGPGSSAHVQHRLWAATPDLYCYGGPLGSKGRAGMAEKAVTGEGFQGEWTVLTGGRWLL